jgi:acyl carrier protein
MVTNKRADHIVQRLREIVLELSGATADSLSDNASFLELGFDSLFLTQLSTACLKEFGIRVTFRQLFTDVPTIAALASFLNEKLPSEYEVKGRASGREEDLRCRGFFRGQSGHQCTSSARNCKAI